MPIGAFKLNTIAKLLSSSVSYVQATGGDSQGYMNLNGVGYKWHRFTLAGSNRNLNITSGGLVDIQIIGGGGGSGGGVNSSTAYSGGGGSGQLLTVTNIPVTPQILGSTVGAAGTAGTTSGTNGGTGGSSECLGYTAVGGGGSAGSAGTAPAGGAAGGGGGGAYQGGVVKSPGTGTYGGGSAQNGGTGTTIGSGGGGGQGSAGGNSSGGVGGQVGYPVISYFRGLRDALGGGGRGNGPNGTPSTPVIEGLSYSRLTASGGGADGAGSTTTSFSGFAGAGGSVAIRYKLPDPFTVNFVTSTTSTASTITIPGTAQVGDVAILFDWGYNATTTAPTLAVPTGFTALQNYSQVTSPACMLAVSMKTLVAGDPGSTLTGLNATTMAKTLLIYRPNYTLNAVTNSAAGGNASSAAPTSRTISPYSKANLISFACYASSGTITTRSSGLVETREISNNTNLYVKTFEFSEGTLSSNTISMADYGSNALYAFTLTFT